MEILAIIGVIAIIAVLFTGGGILGWMLAGLEKIFDLLLEGNTNCMGCIIRIIVGLFLIALVIAGLM